MIEEKELIELIKRERKEEVDFFSSSTEPERWIVNEFLKILQISFSEDEIISQKQYDNVDIVFRDANFQIKEITEPNCRRDEEIKNALKIAESASTLIETIVPPVGKDVINRDGYTLIYEIASNDKKYPPKSRAKLDLLVYVTDTGAFLSRKNQSEELSALGWRSISCLFGSQVYFLVVCKDAPSFILDFFNNNKLINKF